MAGCGDIMKITSSETRRTNYFINVVDCDGHSDFFGYPVGTCLAKACHVFEDDTYCLYAYVSEFKELEEDSYRDITHVMQCVEELCIRAFFWENITV